MADLLGIGSSALRSLQQAISTTGHNISNVGTEGYSRQRVEFSTLEPQRRGGNYLGSGVQVSDVRRVYDQFIEGEILGGSARQAQQDAFYSFSSRMDQLLASNGSNFTTSVQNFFEAAQDVTANPTGLPERQVFLSEAEALVQRQQSLYRSVNGLSLELNERLNASVTEINSLADSIATLNRGIVSASAGGLSPNDLLDRRDVMLQELSSKVGISTTAQDDGAVNVSIGNGYPLVIGGNSQHLQTVTNPYDASRLDVYTTGVGAGSISGHLNGGELQGLLDFRERSLDPVINELGLVTMGLAEQVNAQHRLGADLEGSLGQDLFALGSAGASPHSLNAGGANPSVQIDDISALTGSNYELRFSSGNWTLTRQSDGTSTSGGGPLLMDGMTIDPGAGVPADGDSFLIRPTQAAAASFSAQITDPMKVAVAEPLVAKSEPGNTGNPVIKALVVTDTVDLPLPSTVTLTFNPDALGPGVPGYDVSGGITTTIAYNPATDFSGITVNLGLTGVSLSLRGSPVAGDTLTLDNTGPASGDNRNMLAIADLQFRKSLYGGNATYTEAYSSTVTGVAVDTEAAHNALQLESSLLQNAENQRSSVSGVNLDEEAANLIKYQQQYQAAAQLVSVADSLFQTLLNATGR